jgi:cyclopropane-fatty-acyl-phospholipid synthase
MRNVEPARPIDLDWPYLQPREIRKIRAMLAKRLFLASVRGLRLSVRLPTGAVYGSGRGQFGAGGDPVMRIADPESFFSRLGQDGSLGFGESFILGTWTAGDGTDITAENSDELVAWLQEYAAYVRHVESRWLFQLRSLWHGTLPVSEPNSTSGARRNVQAHYDLDTELFELFLDPSMTYSSAYFEPGDDLFRAQQRKIDSVLDLARVGSTTHLLDIGSGFGALAIRAAQERGARVTGITLSEKQLRTAADSAGKEGLNGRVSFLLEDYRQHAGLYQAIVSVEMIEAVGSAYWADFFSAVDRLLAEGGHFALQVITFPHDKMVASTHDFSWVDRCIFPGGALPSLREITRILNDGTALELVEARRLSESYGRTLREWRHRFLAVGDKVRSLGFDDRFIRLWTLYLSYFEAAFKSRYCDVWQLGMRKRPAS